MASLNNFEYVVVDGKGVWKYGRGDETEVKVETPAKYGAGDYRVTWITPATCERNPTMPAAVLTAGAMIIAQKKWPSHEVFDLDLIGHLERITTAKTIEDVILVAHSCDLAWQMHRRSRGRA